MSEEGWVIPFYKGFSIMRVFLFWLWLATVIGIVSVPLETHEVFVLETARAMESSGDWVMPVFNGAPRLNKPPLNYWFTVLISKCDPSSPDVQIWHGRLVSFLGGLLMLLATARLGTVLYRRETGFLAAALLMGTQGFVHLSGSGRPDQLYASLGVLQLLGWAEAYRSRDRSLRQAAFSMLGWGAAGLATMTKGPQIPILFLVAWGAAMIRSPERKRVLAVLRPLSGILLAAVLCLPWWITLRHEVAALGMNFSDSQLSGSLLLNLAGWKELLGLYYPRTLAVLLLPAAVVLPGLALWRSRKRVPCGRETRILLTVCTVILIAFSLGGHYRKHYLQPILPLVVLLISRWVEVQDAPPLRPAVWKGLVIGLVAGGFGCLALIHDRHVYWVLWLAPVYLAVLVVLLKKVLVSLSWSPPSSGFQLAVLASALALEVCIVNAFLPMSVWRKEQQVFAETVAKGLGPDDRLAEWQAKLELLPFFAQRPVLRGVDLDRLKAISADGSGKGSLYVVLPVGKLTQIGTVFPTEPICRTHYASKKKDDLICVRVKR